MDNLLDDGFNEKQNKQVVYATFWTRVAGSFVDALITMPILLPLTYYNIIVWKSMPVVIVIAILGLMYKVFMEYAYGATWGKMAMRIVVVNYDFEKPDFTEICLRNIVGITSSVSALLSSLYLFSLPEFKDVNGFMEYSVFVNKHTSATTITNIISLAFLVDALLMLSDKQLRTIHDKIGKTYVVKRDSLD
jgi:uncharacterized RDD family membrane protein YckC